jgi:hypothetical protein
MGASPATTPADFATCSREHDLTTWPHSPKSSTAVHDDDSRSR